MAVGGQRQAPAALRSGKRPYTHCIAGWVGPWAGLGGCGKSRPHPNETRSPDRTARSESSLFIAINYKKKFSCILYIFATLYFTFDTAFL